jgi:hypothetical protein
MPWILSVEVDKRRETYTSGQESERYLAAGREKLKQTAAAAVSGAAGMKPLRLTPPLLFEADFREEQTAPIDAPVFLVFRNSFIAFFANRRLRATAIVDMATYFTFGAFETFLPVFLFRLNFARSKDPAVLSMVNTLRDPTVGDRKIEDAIDGCLHAACSTCFERTDGIVEPDINA